MSQVSHPQTLPETEKSSQYHVFFLSSESNSGFRIAFNMFDTDGNQIVDKKEFLVVSIGLLSIGGWVSPISSLESELSRNSVKKKKKVKKKMWSTCILM